MSTSFPFGSPTEMIAAVVEKYDGELVELRRDLHAHPELAWHEVRTTEVVAHRIEESRLVGA